MKDIRKGNDINVAWKIMKDGAPFSLTGKDVHIYLKTPFGKREVKDFSVAGNTISWTFYGKDQNHLGKHSLELVINENEVGMISTDYCDFVNLVSCSCMVGGSDEGNITTESIELTTTLEFVAGEGGGSYDDSAIWEAVTKLNEDKVDKVEGLGLSQESFTTEEKEKLSNIENYDDTGIKQDLAKKANKSEIPTKMSQLEQDIEIGSDYDDTEIKEELAELSAEVSGLSEKVDELGQPIFKAVYGETTYNAIKSAYKSGMVVHCDYIGNCYVLSRIDNNNAYLTCTLGTIVYRIMCSSASTWANATFETEQVKNKTTSLSSASTDTQYPSAKAVYDAVSKKSEVSLEALANGNLKVTIDGVSKDFMAATPSGDPQHYAFMAIGAKYNATANDSSVAAPWAALADDAADKVVIHKAGHWLLNGVGDLTNRDMRHILARGAAVPGVAYSMANAVSDYYNKDNNPGANAVRTNYCFAGTTNFTVEMGTFFNNQVIEVGELSARPNGAHGNIVTKTQYFARLATNLRHIVGVCIPIDTYADAFTGAPFLKTIDVRDLKYNINFKDQPLLTNASILNMINKEKATNAIVITLHADAYARAMANTNIQSALAAHPNVSLAKA